MMPFPGTLAFFTLKNNIRLFKTPGWIQKFYPNRIWRLPNSDNIIYLTFDDGPTEEVTSWILNTLAAYNAKATFFCVGANMKKHPELVKEIERRGHALGNHTFHHKKASEVSAEEYMQDVAACRTEHGTKLFRPPHGRLPSKHAKQLFREGYSIIMWDVLTYDFDANAETEKLWDKIRRNTKPGSIIVFHDNVKAEKHLRILLPKTLEHFSNAGYRFDSICL